MDRRNEGRHEVMKEEMKEYLPYLNMFIYLNIYIIHKIPESFSH